MMQTKLPRLHVGQALHVGPLSVFPVWVDSAEIHGLASEPVVNVEVTEREESPVVGELVVANPGPKPVLLLGGELFEGGWQHRSLNHDVIVAPASQHVASVSCVEAARWRGPAGQARRMRRASILVRSAQSLSPGHERQDRVWGRVSHYDRTFGASETSSYVEHLDRTELASNSTSQVGMLVRGLQQVRPMAGQRGVLIGLVGQPILLELFPTSAILQQHLSPLLQAAALDAALLPAIPTPGRRARRVIERLAPLRLTTDVTRDGGAGRLTRGGTAYNRVDAISWDDQLAHATIFNPRHPLLAAA